MAEENIQPVASVPPVSTAPAISNTPYPEVLTPTTTQAQSVLNQYGIDIKDVLSASNVAQTTTNPAPKPDDLLGIRSQIYSEQGVNTAQEAYMNAMKAASSASLGLSERLTGLRGRAVSLSKITGTQAQERAVSQGEIDALNESARIAAADYAAKKGNADEMFQIRNQEISEKKQIMLKYPGAKVTFGDSFESIQKKLSKYQKEQKDEAYKDALKAEARSLGLKTSGSKKDLEKRISSANKSALESAKRKSELEIKALEADIANTYSTIANRGNSNEEMVPYYKTQPDGTIQQAVNDDGSPVMIPKNSKIFNVKSDDDELSFENGTGNEDTSILGGIKNWWNSWSF